MDDHALLLLALLEMLMAAKKKERESSEVKSQMLLLCGNCVFPQNIHTRKLGEMTVFYAVFMQRAEKSESKIKLHLYSGLRKELQLATMLRAVFEN